MWREFLPYVGPAFGAVVLVLIAWALGRDMLGGPSWGTAAPRARAWLYAPRVMRHPRSPVTSQEVVRAVSWWRDKGHPMLISGDTAADRWHARPGEILIGVIDGTVRNEWHAQTATIPVSGDTAAIAMAEISFNPLPDDPELRFAILIHEIGHALGYGHSTHPANAMRVPVEAENTAAEGLWGPEAGPGS